MSESVAVDVGRRRRLLRLTDDRGIVVGLALDHRDSFRAALAGAGIQDASLADLRRLKKSLVCALVGEASALMLDEELGLDALRDGNIPSRVGLMMPLEEQGYEAIGDGRATRLLADFSPAVAAAYGADACKLLLPYRPDAAQAAGQQERLVAETIQACHSVGLPLVVEPIAFRLPDESAASFDASFTDLVVTSASRMASLGVDLLKLPFPARDGASDQAAEDACLALNAACQGRPWVLLGGLSDTAHVQQQLAVACAAGASGFLAGRSVWGPALRLGTTASVEQVRDATLAAFLACRAIAREQARPLI